MGRQTCQSTNCYKPAVFTCIQECCCCTTMAQLPCLDGIARCVCCGNDCCGVKGGFAKVAQRGNSLQLEGMDHYDRVCSETFLPCFCCACCGLGFANPYTMINIVYKLCCRHCVFTTQIPAQRDKLCGCLCQWWWLVSQCRIPPPLPPNPVCALCGWRARTPV